MRLEALRPDKTSNMQSTGTNKPLNFKLLSATADDELFEQYPNADWDYDILSANNRISEDIVTKYAYKPWNYIKLSTKTNIKHRFDKYDAKMKKEMKTIKKSKNKLNFDL